MSENTENTETTEAIVVKTTFGEVLGIIEPAPVREMIVAKLDESLNLRKAQNARVYEIQASKASDPNSFEVQDATWKRIQESTEEKSNEEKAITAKANRFDKVAKEYERLLQELRDMAKAEIKPPLSEDEIKAKRKEYNDTKPIVEVADIAAKAMAEMADSILRPLGQEIEGGVFSLMPTVESLMNSRGRKSAGGTRSTDGYATRIGSMTLDGEDIAKNGKYSWAILSNAINAKVNATRFPENGVTPLELEEEFFKSANLGWRDKGLPEMHDFVLEKEIQVQNSNDDSTKSVPVKFAIHFAKWTPAPKEETENVTEGATENAETENA